MLEEISRADYGMDADEHLAALIPIRGEMRVPTPMHWEPREVLELIRWSQPEDPGWKPGSTGARGHIMRAFCCAALLRAGAEPANVGYLIGENQTVIQLIESALFLSNGLPEATARFLTWRFPQMRSDDDERPFVAFGLVALAVLLGHASLAASDVDALADFVEEAEADIRDPMRVCTADMFRGSFLTATHFNLRHAAWLALAARLKSRRPDSKRLAELIRRIEAR
jgi:hypothetical protein